MTAHNSNPEIQLQKIRNILLASQALDTFLDTLDSYPAVASIHHETIQKLALNQYQVLAAAIRTEVHGGQHYEN
jgi:hypothetical protein